MNLLDDTNDQNNIDQNKDYLKELIGPNGKFYDPDEKNALQKLAKGKHESDAYIKTLEPQLDAMRADLLKWREEAMTRASLEELADRLTSNRGTANSNDNLNANAGLESKPSLDQKAVEDLVATKLQEIERNKQQEQNYNTVFNKVKEVYGDDFVPKLRRQATELGMSNEEVNQLARTNPKVFLRTFGVEQGNRENFQVPPHGMRSDNFQSGTNKRTWAYYQELRKSDPKAYYDKNTQVQMHQDAYALGEAFKDGDWNASN